MLIKDGLSANNLQRWKTAESKQVKSRLQIIASKSKHAPITSKIIYSIIEIFKSIIGKSDFQNTFKDYKKQTIANLNEKGVPPEDYSNRDLKRILRCRLECEALKNDLKMNSASSEDERILLGKLERVQEKKLAKFDLVPFLRLELNW